MTAAGTKLPHQLGERGSIGRCAARPSCSSSRAAARSRAASPRGRPTIRSPTEHFVEGVGAGSEFRRIGARQDAVTLEFHSAIAHSCRRPFLTAALAGHADGHADGCAASVIHYPEEAVNGREKAALVTAFEPATTS